MRLYLDTNVFIRAFESSPDEARPLQRLFEALRQNWKLSVTSELTLAEVLAPHQSVGPHSAATRRRVYLNLIVWTGFIDLQPITRSILYETADLRKLARHKLPDAIHIVTAIQAGCVFFMSNDEGTKRLPDTMTHLKADEGGVEVALGALRA